MKFNINWKKKLNWSQNVHAAKCLYHKVITSGQIRKLNLCKACKFKYDPCYLHLFKRNVNSHIPTLNKLFFLVDFSTFLCNSILCRGTWCLEWSNSLKKSCKIRRKNSYGEWSPPNSILSHKINMHLKLNNYQRSLITLINSLKIKRRNYSCKRLQRVCIWAHFSKICLILRAAGDLLKE